MIDPVRFYILGVEGAADDNMEDYEGDEKENEVCVNFTDLRMQHLTPLLRVSLLKICVDSICKLFTCSKIMVVRAKNPATVFVNTNVIITGDAITNPWGLGQD